MRRCVVLGLAFLVSGLAWGCVNPSSIECADGRVCSEQFVCDNANHLCVTHEQLVTCVGLADGMDCTIGGGTPGYCSAEVCVPSRCGDGMIRGSERCDGENLAGKTGCKDLGYYADGPIACTADCVFDTSMCGGGVCGDHIVQAQEFCEDGAIPPATSCLDFGFDLGRIGCTTACAPDYAACERFGFFSVVSGTTQRLGTVWGTGPDNVYAAGIASVIHYDGSTWTAMDPNTSGALIGMHGSAPDNVWAVGLLNVVTHFDGSAWSATTIPGGVDYLLDVWTSGPNDVYVVGAEPGGGKIFHWNGTAWSSFAVSQGLQGVWGVSPTDIYAVGDGGLIAHWNGSAWSTISVTTQQLAHVWASGPDDVWAVGSEIWHKDASGWSQVTSPVPVGYVNAVTGVGSHVMLAVDKGVLVGDASGLVLIPTVKLEGMWAAASDDVWAVSAGGTRHFTGTAWLDDLNPSPADMNDASGVSASYAAALTQFGVVQVWDGHAWTSLPSTGTGLLGLWVAGVDDIFAVSYGNGQVWRWSRPTPTSAPNWQMIKDTIDSPIAIYGRSVNDVWVVCDTGMTHHYNGSSWQSIATGSNTSLTAVWAASDTAVFAGGGSILGGAIYTYNGATWTRTYQGSNVISGIYGTAANNVFAVGTEGILHWDGAAWTVVDAGIVESLRAISGTGPNDIFAGGANGALTHFDGTTWSEMRALTTQMIEGIYATPSRLFLAGDSTRVLYRKP